ncbi:transcriptional regulator GutM [Enterococcus devriesei]|uniref:transcriptional regulator GutM n=1 Tax=Enterococcus devriesei TaxID=319970 RepID=UPI0036D4160E
METRILIIAFFLLVLNFVTSILHTNYYRKTLNSLVAEKNDGFLGVGMSKSKIKGRNILILTTDSSGVINDCRVMSGLTIFSRFKKFDDVMGHDIAALPENIQQGKYRDSLHQAIELIKAELNKN